MKVGNILQASCDHCKRYIDFPQSMCGERIACPACGKQTFLPYGAQINADAYHKTVCNNCGIHVEYPAASEGQTVNCPQCGKFVSLRRIGRISPSHISNERPQSLEPIRPPPGSGPKNTGMPVERPNYAAPTPPMQRSGHRMRDGQDFSDSPWLKVPNRTEEEKVAFASRPSTPVEQKKDKRTGFPWFYANLVFLLVMWWIGAYRWSAHDIRYLRDKTIGFVDGQPYRAAIDEYLRANANDPSSVEIDSLTSYPPNPNGCRSVSCNFRAKNSLGAVVLNDWVFVIDANNNVVSAQNYTQ